MSTFVGDEILRRAGADVCPSWCMTHTVAENGDILHGAVVTVGAVSVEIEQWADGVPRTEYSFEGGAIIPPDLEWIKGQDAHDYAEALRRAAQLIYPLGNDS